MSSLKILCGVALELDHDGGGLFGHILAGAQVERDTLPPLVVDEKTTRDIGFGRRIGVYLLLLAIAASGLALDRPGSILTPYYIFKDLVGRPEPDMFQHFSLGVTDGFGLIFPRAIHGHDA